MLAAQNLRDLFNGFRFWSWRNYDDQDDDGYHDDDDYAEYGCNVDYEDEDDDHYDGDDDGDDDVDYHSSEVCASLPGQRLF